jgi:hypothetical protein
MLHQVDDALPHAMSGTELSRVRTELRLLPPKAYQQKSDRVERGRHCYAIKWETAPVKAQSEGSCKHSSAGLRANKVGFTDRQSVGWRLVFGAHH